MLLPQFFYQYYGWCYCHGGWCYCHLVANFVGWCYCHSSWCYCYIIYKLADVIAIGGWCWYHFGTFVLADVVAMVVDVKTTQGVYRCVWQMLKPIVVDGITTGQQLFLSLVLRCEEEPCPKCVADGICQYFYLGMDYLLLCTRLLLLFSRGYGSSLPKMVKLSMVTLWTRDVNMVMCGGWGLRCSLYLSSKFLADSPMYSSSQSTLSHLYLYMTPLFSGVDLCPLGPLGGPWWYGLLWDAHQSHTFCTCFCNSHWVLDGRELQCRALEFWCYLTLICFADCLFFFLQLRPGSLASLCWWPSVDIYISWGIDVSASLLFATS